MRKMQNHQNYNSYYLEKIIFNKKLAQKLRTSHQEHIKTFFVKYTFIDYFWEARRFVSPYRWQWAFPG